MMLKGQEAERFIEQDKKPLSKKSIQHLERCRQVYLQSNRANILLGEKRKADAIRKSASFLTHSTDGKEQTESKNL